MEPAGRDCAGPKEFHWKDNTPKRVSISGEAYAIKLNLASQSMSEKGLAVQAAALNTKSVYLPE